MFDQTVGCENETFRESWARDPSNLKANCVVVAVVGGVVVVAVFLGSLRPAIEPKFRYVVFPLLGCAFVFCTSRPGGMRDTLKTRTGRPTLNLRKKALLEEGLLVAPVSRQVESIQKIL